MRQPHLSLILVCLALSACSVAQPAAEMQPAAATTLESSAIPRAMSGNGQRPAGVPTRPLAPGQVANYESAPCRFDLPDNTSPECGYLTVPEDRANPNGRTIRLHVAVFKSMASNPKPDPVVYLQDGPGGNVLEIVKNMFDDAFWVIAQERDVIVVDQRGTGLSEPALDCPELRDLGYELLDKHVESADSQKQDLAAVQTCHDRLVGQGIDLSAYTSAANAADLDDLRKALGYDAWNLYGIGYGARLALTALRDTPTGIRSVILDSIYPPQASITDQSANAARSLQLLFDSCAQDPACNQAYPNLKQAFLETVDRLATKPVTVSIADPFTSKPYDVLFDGKKLIGTLVEMLSQSYFIPKLPNILYRAYQGKSYDILATSSASGVFGGDFFSVGMYFAVQCGEEVPFSTAAQFAAASAAYPDLRDVQGNLYFVDVCKAWNVRAAPARENEPVRSDVPVLIEAGQFDPNTPPSYGREAANTLQHSFFLEFPGLGNRVSADQCPQGLLLAFLDNPTTTPDSSCIAQMPKLSFETP